MGIKEPTTTITDYILAAETLLFGLLLLRSDQTSVRFWGIAFLTTAIAAAAGGTFHGFEFAGIGGTVLWKITVYAIGLSSLFLFLGAIRACSSATIQPWLSLIAILHFAAYAYWMIHHDDFRYVIFDYLPAMVATLLLQIMSFHQPSAAWIISGILLSFVAAVVQQTGIVFYKYFNFNDAYHVIQMVAMWLLYRGGLLLKDI